MFFCTNISTFVGDNSFQATTDVCLMRGEMVLLPVIHGNPEEIDPGKAEGQAITAAIAAFLNNNRVRDNLGYDELCEMTIPCIVMRRTVPEFYLIPVTKNASASVAAGNQPKRATCFDKCKIDLIGFNLDDVTMEDPKFRKTFLQFLDAFKELARQHWEKFVAAPRRRRMRGTMSSDLSTIHSSD